MHFRSLPDAPYGRLRWIQSTDGGSDDGESFISFRQNNSDVVKIEMNDTGDTVELDVYIANQLVNGSVQREDGMKYLETFEGDIFPEEEKEEFINMVEKEYGFKPRIDPVDKLVPPDMIFVTEENNNE